MKYIIQILVMLGDLALLAASIVVIYKLGFLGCIITLLTYSVWKSQGGLIAWRRKNIKKFMKNAKEMGL